MEHSLDDVKKLKASFVKLNNAVDNICIKSTSYGDTYDGGYIFQLLNETNVKKFFSLKKNDYSLHQTLTY